MTDRAFPTAAEIMAALPPSPFDDAIRDADDLGPDAVFAPPPPVVKTRAERRHHVIEPHVHDPDGSCVRNRNRYPCDAPVRPDTPGDHP